MGNSADKYYRMPTGIRNPSFVDCDYEKNEIDHRYEIQRSEYTKVYALHKYIATDDTDVSFNEGDVMEVIEECDRNWWKVCHLITGQVGLAPRNFITINPNYQREPWFLDHLSRAEATKLLLSSDHPVGTFLIRLSERSSIGYSLSVRDQELTGPCIKHYKIRQSEKKDFFISSKQRFNSLAELVSAYSNDAGGLCQKLTRPCPRPTPKVSDNTEHYEDQWEISKDKLEIKRKLGEGNFGEVHLALMNGTMPVAVKCLRSESEATSQAFLLEAEIMKKYRHKRLVALFAVCTKDKPFYIVQEYISKGSLLDFLRSDEGKTYKSKELLRISLEICEGMVYLESHKLIHRDLAARNVLLDDNYEIKICDFGLARVIENNEYQIRTGAIPIKWTAPEAFDGKFCGKSDVWSFGVLLMEIVTYGQIPYPGMDHEEIKRKIREGYRMPKPNGEICSDELYEIMLNCWKLKPEERPSFKYLYEWLEDKQMEDLLK